MSYTERRVKVADFYLDGKFQTEIAQQLGVSQGTISNDLKAIRLQWQAEYATTFDTIVAEQLAKIDKVEREAWIAWERSTEDEVIRAVTTRAARGDDDSDSDDGFITEQKKTTKGQAGDPRFLQQVEWCIEQRLKIVGGYAKDKRAEQKAQNEERWMTELIEALKSGRVSPQEVQELFPDLAEQFFAQAGVDVRD